MVKVRYYNASRVRRPLMVAVVAALVGVAVLVAGMMSLAHTRSFLSGATPVMARVVAMQVDRSGKSPSYLPMFEFADAGGTVQRVPGWQSAPEYGYAKDEMVEVLFNPAQPGTVRIDRWRDGWRPGLNILFVALFFLVLALLGLVVHLRWMRERPGYANRGDWLPEDAGDETVIHVNSEGRVRFLKNPRLTAIVLGVAGAGMATAGAYGVASGSDMGGEDQVTAFFVGAVVFLGLAAWAALVHLKHQRVRAARQARRAQEET